MAQCARRNPSLRSQRIEIREIRVLDTQECPRADLAISAAAVDILRTPYRETHGSLPQQQSITTDALEKILHASIQDAEQAVIADVQYLHLMGFSRSPLRCGRAMAAYDWVNGAHSA
ncbi:MAG: hypothetical protein H0X43_08190 [Nitrosospira sp.]|nr:hypothetical protein [Nitrosospira sp.]